MEILIRTHAGLMLIAFGLVVGGFLVARIARKKRWWLKFHRALGIIGTSAMVLGLFAGTLDISLTGREHLAIPHAWLGLAVVALGMLTPVLGLFLVRLGGRVPLIRPLHRWSGRVTLILMAVNILLGLRAAGLI
jgi:hypothetical protein